MTSRSVPPSSIPQTSGSIIPSLLLPGLCCLDPDSSKVQGHFSTGQREASLISRNRYPTILASPSLPSPFPSTVHKICLGVISPPTQENNERQWHDRLDIDEIAAATICTARLGPSFAFEMEKGAEGMCVCVGGRKDEWL